MIHKYKIVFKNSVSSTNTELFNVVCSDPFSAVSAYVRWRIDNCNGAYTSAQVFHADPLAILTVGTEATEATEESEASKLFNGYMSESQPVPATCCQEMLWPVVNSDLIPKTAKFKTPDSGWIIEVSWQQANSSLCIHFKRGGYIVYESSFDVYEAFKEWVATGGSAGHMYNEHVKGLRVLKRK